MFRFLTPCFEGSYPLRRPASELLDAMVERLASGLLVCAPPNRNRYAIDSRTNESLVFHSTTVWTGISIGLNRVQLDAPPGSNEVRYRVSYWTWARYALGLGAVICAPMLLFLMVAQSGVVEIPPEWIAPPRQMLIFGLPMLIFWGLVWPWILIVLHKRSAARCLERILAEVDADTESAPDG